MNKQSNGRRKERRKEDIGLSITSYYTNVGEFQNFRIKFFLFKIVNKMKDFKIH